MQNRIFSKLLEKFASIKKPLIAGTLAMGMLVAPLTGCDLGTVDGGVDNKPPITIPDDPNNENPSDNDNQGGDITQNPYFQSYSKILQTVITGSYYNDVIKYEQKKYDEQGISYMTTRDNYCLNVPYGFLYDQGYNIDAIKTANNEAVKSEVFIFDDEPNNLYIKCAVLNRSSIDFYDTYLLKYQLTDTELRDLNRLFDMKESGFIHFKRAMYQAPFFIQELSYQKEPEVLLHGGIEANTFKWFIKNLSPSDLTSDVYEYLYLSKTKNGSGVVPIYTNQSETLEETTKDYTMQHNLYITSCDISCEPDNYIRGTATVYESINCMSYDFKTNPPVVKTIDGIQVLDLSSKNLGFAFYFNDYCIVDNTQAVAKTATFYTIDDAYLLNGLVSNENKSYFKDTSWLYKEMTADNGTNAKAKLENNK